MSCVGEDKYWEDAMEETQPNVERYVRDNNRQTIGKLGFAGFGKNE